MVLSYVDPGAESGYRHRNRDGLKAYRENDLHSLMYAGILYTQVVCGPSGPYSLYNALDTDNANLQTGTVHVCSLSSRKVYREDMLCHNVKQSYGGALELSKDAAPS